MNDRGLAVSLRAYEITSKNMRIGELAVRVTPSVTLTMLGRGIYQPPSHPLPALHPLQTLHRHKSNGHDEISHDERVELMMKHNGMTREQAEAEASQVGGLMGGGILQMTPAHGGGHRNALRKAARSAPDRASRPICLSERLSAYQQPEAYR